MKNSSPERPGFVYVLTSKNSEYIKIGGSDYPPLKRVKEINCSVPYKNHGTWHIAKFIQVDNWREVEYSIHYSLRSKLVKEIKGQKELFSISLKEASNELDKIDPEIIIKKPKVDRMFLDTEFFSYMKQLFLFTGLPHWLDIQGAWTLVLFPATAGGRYFTLNIGTHEVAFSTLAKAGFEPGHLIVMDQLILDFDEVKRWVKHRKGSIKLGTYRSALPRAASVSFFGSFNDALAFLKLPGVRRALIAYWYEALINLKERGVLSPYAKSHNLNAVAKICSELDF